MINTRRAVQVSLVVLAACEGGGPLWPEGAPPIRTDAAVYTLETIGDFWTGRIPIEYENRGNRTWYLVNCGGLYGWRLEKWVGERWEAAYGPVLPLCLSPAIRIEPAETLSDTLHVDAGHPGTNTAPQFAFPDPAGTYRVVLETLSSYDERRYPFGALIPLDQRVSNAFELRVADEPQGP